MTPTRLNGLLTTALLAGSITQAGCYPIAMGLGGGCSTESASGLVDESLIEWNDKLTPHGVQAIDNCYEICAYELPNLHGSDSGFTCWESGTADLGQIEVTCEWTYCPVGGRRTEGLGRSSSPIPKGGLSLTPRSMARTSTQVAARLRQFAFMERSAVYAFGQLKAELRAHRAPRRLIALAARAQKDERRHAKVMSAHAKRWGAKVETPCYKPPATIRSLKAIAMENAVEGCVYETWSALVARRQAERSTDIPFKRSALNISKDETRHAALSWELHRHLMGRLSKEERLEVRRAQFRARAELHGTIEKDLEPYPLEAIGLPGRQEGLEMWRTLERTLPFDA